MTFIGKFGQPLIFLVSSMVVVGYVFPAASQLDTSLSVNFDSVDAEATIISQSNLKPLNQDVYRCRCRKRFARIFGMGFKQLPSRCSASCVGVLSIPDLYVQKVKSITYGVPRNIASPDHLELRNIELINCSNSPLPWSELVTIETENSVTAQMTRGLSKVKAWEISLSLEASISKVFSAGLTGRTGESITVSLTNSEASSKKEKSKVEKPLSANVPSWTVYTLSYGEKRQEEEIPVEIEVVLDGTVQEEHAVYDPVIRAKTGELAAHGHLSPRRLKAILSEVVREEALRTIKTTAILRVSGGSRDIWTKANEKPLTEHSEECRE